MKEAVEEIKEFITKQKDANRKESIFHSICKIEKEACHPLTRLDLDNDKTIGKSFRLCKDHPTLTHPVKTLFSIAKADENQDEETKEANFPKYFTKLKEGERQLEEKSPSEWLDAEIKYREVDISTDDRPKIAKIGDY